jgi:hypothetical protein
MATDLDLSLPINLELLKHPLNWVVIYVTLLLVSYSLFVLWTNIPNVTPLVHPLAKKG